MAAMQAPPTDVAPGGDGAAVAGGAAEGVGEGGGGDREEHEGEGEGFTGLQEAAAVIGGEDEDQDGDDDDNTPDDEGDNGGEGLLDDALVLALPIIENEIFGSVAAAKEAANYAANYKEARKVCLRFYILTLCVKPTQSTLMGAFPDFLKPRKGSAHC
jgi:hypothetical protein